MRCRSSGPRNLAEPPPQRSLNSKRTSAKNFPTSTAVSSKRKTAANRLPATSRFPRRSFGDRVVAVPYLLGLYPKPKDPRSLHSGLEIARRLLPPGHLVVACESDLFTLSLKSKPGCIWYWDHETDDVEEDTTGTGIDRYRPSAARLLANSFDEFLTRIAMYREGR